MIQFRVGSTGLSRLDELADIHGLSRSVVIRVLLGIAMSHPEEMLTALDQMAQTEA